LPFWILKLKSLVFSAVRELLDTEFERPFLTDVLPFRNRSSYSGSLRVQDTLSGFEALLSGVTTTEM